MKFPADDDGDEVSTGAGSQGPIAGMDTASSVVAGGGGWIDVLADVSGSTPPPSPSRGRLETVMMGLGLAARIEQE